MSDPTASPNDRRRTPRLALGDLLLLSVSSLGTNRLRSFLTMLGITIGVFSVVGVMTALSAVRASIDSGLNVLGAAVFQISKFPAVQVGGRGWARFRNRPDINYREYQELEERLGDQVRFMTPNYRRGGQIFRFEDRTTEPRFRVVGGNEWWVECYKFEIASGRNLTADDIEYVRPVVILGADIVDELFPDRDPVGEWITIRGSRYRVIGTFVSKGTLFGDAQDNFALAPITRALQDFSAGRRRVSVEIAIQAWSMEDLEETRETAIGAMRVVRRQAPDEPNNFEVFSNESLLDAFAKIARQVQIGGFIISAVALLTAGVGIMNIMLVSVTERTREIGVRMSLGARRWDVLRQFLLEAVFLSNLGGAAGILLGIIVGNGIAMQFGVDVIFPWLWAGIAVIICCFIGITFGFYPAWKAARMNPVEALRYE